MADNDEQVAKPPRLRGGQGHAGRRPPKSTRSSSRMAATASTSEKKEKGTIPKWIATAHKKLATFDATQRHRRHHLAKAARFEKRRHELDAAGTCCAVVDFDMFYAAVEIRDRPELKDKPVAVGGIGMISTANYVARKWGVRSAMPGFIGQALCRRGPEFGMPRTELVFVSPDFAKYERVAGIARAIFAQYDPLPRTGRRSLHRPDALPAVPCGLR